ncbi:MAG: nucleoside-diphosphate kinase [Ardenticatenales bacterium]
MERTLIILKPDAVQRALVGELTARLERRGLRISGLKLLRVTEKLAGEHYQEHVGKPFFAGLVAYITSSPVVVMAVDGPGAIALVRTTVGVTKPAEAAPGTIRADYGVDIGRNLIHASANADDAARELALWFAAGELIDYTRDIDRWIVEA